MSTTATAPAKAEGHIDPAAAFVPVQTRSERPWSNDPADFPIPSGREVNWKHTPVARLAALLADAAGDHQAVSLDLDEVEALLATPEATAPVAGEFFRPEDRASALAHAHAPGVLHVQLAEDAPLDAPVHVPITGTDAAGLAHHRILIEALPNARGTLVLDHTGSAQYAQNVEIIVRDGAAITVVSVQAWDDDAIHLATHQARVDRDASLTHIVVSLGGSIVRVNPSIELAGPGSSAKVLGLAFADAGQHLESQVFLYHKGQHTSGNVLYKGALQGASAHTVWIGDVLIGPDAVGTDSYEANRNLVLTEGARADSIPNLEIETGDIQGAGHASATGRFDDEQLFYLQARGIPEDEARRLVVLGFLAEIIQQIGDAPLEERLRAAVEAELAAGSAKAAR